MKLPNWVRSGLALGSGFTVAEATALANGVSPQAIAQSLSQFEASLVTPSMLEYWPSGMVFTSGTQPVCIQSSTLSPMGFGAVVAGYADPQIIAFAQAVAATVDGTGAKIPFGFRPWREWNGLQWPWATGPTAPTAPFTGAIIDTLGQWTPPGGTLLTGLARVTLNPLTGEGFSTGQPLTCAGYLPAGAGMAVIVDNGTSTVITMDTAPSNTGTGLNVYDGQWSYAEYISAWLYFWNLMTENGATNASWIWCLDHATSTYAPNNYPGDAFVDHTSFDNYNKSTYGTWASETSPMYSELTGSLNPTVGASTVAAGSNGLTIAQIIAAGVVDIAASTSFGSTGYVTVQCVGGSATWAYTATGTGTLTWSGSPTVSYNGTAASTSTVATGGLVTSSTNPVATGAVAAGCAYASATTITVPNITGIGVGSYVVVANGAHVGYLTPGAQVSAITPSPLAAVGNTSGTITVAGNTVSASMTNETLIFSGVGTAGAKTIVVAEYETTQYDYNNSVTASTVNVSSTVAAGSNGLTIAQIIAAGVLDVASSSLFPAAGVLTENLTTPTGATASWAYTNTGSGTLTWSGSPTVSYTGGANSASVVSTSDVVTGILPAGAISSFPATLTGGPSGINPNNLILLYESPTQGSVYLKVSSVVLVSGTTYTVNLVAGQSIPAGGIPNGAVICDPTVKAAWVTAALAYMAASQPQISTIQLFNTSDALWIYPMQNDASGLSGAAWGNAVSKGPWAIAF